MSVGLWLLQSTFDQRNQTEESIECLATKERGYRRIYSDKGQRRASSIQRRQTEKSAKQTSPVKSAPSSIKFRVVR